MLQKINIVANVLVSAPHTAAPNIRANDNNHGRPVKTFRLMHQFARIPVTPSSSTAVVKAKINNRKTTVSLAKPIDKNVLNGTAFVNANATIPSKLGQAKLQKDHP